jgi:LmbE family N-acetylglucosaminyl deacetylase
MPWNNINFQTVSFVHLSERHIQTKLKSVKCYRSQLGKKYANEDFIKGLARTRGVQCGMDYAETFEVIRWVIK